MDGVACSSPHDLCCYHQLSNKEGKRIAMKRIELHRLYKIICSLKLKENRKSKKRTKLNIMDVVGSGHIPFQHYSVERSAG
jgi:uncharacterized cysteine cluster protein YcgN (CxxCxxCC family)